MTSPITYIPNFVPDHAKWFDRLWNELAWEKRPDAPRKEYWTNLFGRSYTYGKGLGERTYHAQADHELIVEARNKLVEQFGHTLEGCFLNGYGTSRDWLGWHADDDPGIDHTKPIAVITVGQGRVIEFRPVLSPRTEDIKATYGEKEGIMLESGSLLLMHAGMQHTHEHRIPKASFEAKPRISMTYRGLIG